MDKINKKRQAQSREKRTNDDIEEGNVRKCICSKV